MRNPSIHITQDLFTQEFTKLCKKHNIKAKHKELLVEELFIACSRYSISSRSIYVNSDKALKKTEKIKLTGISNTALFSNLLYLSRLKLKHRGVTQIKMGSTDWLQLKSIVSLADQFLSEFGLNAKQGYTSYIELALNKLQRFSLNKIPSLHGSICNEYDALVKIKQDKTPDATLQAYKAYEYIVTTKTGCMQYNYQKYPEKYCVFVEIKEVCRKLGVEPRVYIAAQFDSFSYRDSVPDPLQLIGDKAMIRFTNYCYSNNINLKKTQSKSIRWDQVKEK